MSATPATSTNLSSTITMNVSGGTNPMQYSIGGSTYQDSNIFNVNLSPGNYMAYAKDAMNCLVTHPFTISGTSESSNSSTAPEPTLLTSPYSCGQSWSGHNQEWLMDFQNNTIRSGNDMTRGGGAYVWVEGSGFTSTSQVINALTTLMPTYWYGYNKVESAPGLWDHPQSGQPGAISLAWSDATVTDGKLTRVCIDEGYRNDFEEEDDHNGNLIRKSAIAVGNNGVAYFMPSEPVFAWSGIGNHYNRQAGSLTRFQGFATIGEVFQHIRDTNNLASSVDFALVITYGNGEYGPD